MLKVSKHKGKVGKSIFKSSPISIKSLNTTPSTSQSRQIHNSIRTTTKQNNNQLKVGSPRQLRQSSHTHFTSSCSLSTTNNTTMPITTTDDIKSNPSHSRRHRLVIVGGGASGLELATRLGNEVKDQPVDVLLLSCNLSHIWKPHLHMYAAGTLNSYEDELNYFGHSASNNFGFHLGAVTNISPERQQITLAPTQNPHNPKETIVDERFIEYDTLVMAIGSRGNDFGTPGAKEHAIFLDSRPQADFFQKEFINCYLKAQGRHINKYHGEFVPQTVNPDHQFDLNICAVGAGSTGVELVAELLYASRNFNKIGLPGIDAKDVNISLIEGAPRILNGLSADIAATAHQYLVDQGIKIHVNTRVKQIEADRVICTDNQTGEDKIIKTNLVAWCAGITAEPWLSTTGLETSHLNQLIVKPTLQTTRYNNIFAMGDCSSLTLPQSTRPLPPTAQVAHQQATHLSKALKLHIKHGPDYKLPDFEFHDKGVLVSLSKNYTVGKIFGNFFVHGFSASLMYYSMYRFHQIELHGLFKTGVWIVKDLLATMNGQPQIKLH